MEAAVALCQRALPTSGHIPHAGRCDQEEPRDAAGLVWSRRARTQRTWRTKRPCGHESQGRSPDGNHPLRRQVPGRQSRHDGDAPRRQRARPRRPPQQGDLRVVRSRGRRARRGGSHGSAIWQHGASHRIRPWRARTSPTRHWGTVLCSGRSRARAYLQTRGFPGQVGTVIPRERCWTYAILPTSASSSSPSRSPRSDAEISSVGIADGGMLSAQTGGTS